MRINSIACSRVELLGLKSVVIVGEKVPRLTFCVGIRADYGAPAAGQQHFPQGLVIGIVLAVVGVLLAIFAIATLIVHRRAPLCHLTTAQPTRACLVSTVWQCSGSSNHHNQCKKVPIYCMCRGAPVSTRPIGWKEHLLWSAFAPHQISAGRYSRDGH